jgi:predicted NAD-dependent protein-ADP-ribosyltransferase YbiA (DUF1768 family)
MTHSIHFYKVSDSFGEFSNFSPHPITLKGRTWPTSEHYFQAQKFAGTEQEEAIRLTESPMIAARMGRSRALRAKFTEHHKLRSLLLSTGAAELVEHTRNDSYWGDGGDGTGKNKLGTLLMELRAQLKAEE